MPVEVDGDIKPGQVRLYPGQPLLWMVEDPATLRELERRMTLVQRGARAKVRRRTGRLFSTIRKQNHLTRRGPAVDVVAGERGMAYTGYEHDGTAPHVIAARRRKALRFVVGGRVVFRSKVRHPGTKGSNFLLGSFHLANG